MNDPCENKSYIAKGLLYIEVYGMKFSTGVSFDFELWPKFNLDQDELENEARKVFVNKHQEIFDDVSAEIDIISVKSL